MLRLLFLSCVPLIAACYLHDPVGVVLVYELDKTREASADRIPIDRILAAVRRRVRMVGEAEATSEGRIEVRVYGDDPATVRERLEHAGQLEFRIVASRNDNRHRDVIALAEKQGSENKQDSGKRSLEVLDENVPVAKWVKLVESDANQFPNTDKYVSRHDGDGRQEILVLLDRYNVTGEHLASVSAGTDPFGKPCIDFVLNAEGAKRLGKLTEANLPDERAGNCSSLAIILDGKVHSAPLIRSQIGNRGEITGNFTEEQTNELAAVLSAGSLPAPLRLVSERRVESAE